MLKNLFYFALLTTVFVLSWIGFGIYDNFTKSTISSDTQIRIIPISSTFDTKTIDSLKTKKVITVDLQEKIAFPTSSTVDKNASSSSVPQNTFQGTQSAQTTSGFGL